MRELHLPTFPVALLALGVAAACTGAPPGELTGPGEDPAASLSAVAAADRAPPLLEFETLSFRGRMSGNTYTLDVSVLDAVAVMRPPHAAGPLMPEDPKQLGFFGPEGGKGRYIEGAGLIKNTPRGVSGRGALVEVPVTVTSTNVPQAPTTGTLTIDLTEGVVEPQKGDFFGSCGERCLLFQIEAEFDPAGEPAPCLLTGTFFAGVPSLQEQS